MTFDTRYRQTIIQRSSLDQFKIEMWRYLTFFIGFCQLKIYFVETKEDKDHLVKTKDKMVTKRNQNVFEY